VLLLFHYHYLQPSACCVLVIAQGAGDVMLNTRDSGFCFPLSQKKKVKETSVQNNKTGVPSSNFKTNENVIISDIPYSHPFSLVRLLAVLY